MARVGAGLAAEGGGWGVRTVGCGTHQPMYTESHTAVMKLISDTISSAVKVKTCWGGGGGRGEEQGATRKGGGVGVAGGEAGARGVGPAEKQHAAAHRSDAAAAAAAASGARASSAPPAPTPGPLPSPPPRRPPAC